MSKTTNVNIENLSKKILRKKSVGGEFIRKNQFSKEFLAEVFEIILMLVNR